jgi:hypothetical protein
LALEYGVGRPSSIPTEALIDPRYSERTEPGHLLLCFFLFFVRAARPKDIILVKAIG